jgi:hypothetical protein
MHSRALNYYYYYVVGFFGWGFCINLYSSDEYSIIVCVEVGVIICLKKNICYSSIYDG